MAVERCVLWGHEFATLLKCLCTTDSSPLSTPPTPKQRFSHILGAPAGHRAETALPPRPLSLTGTDFPQVLL